MRKLASRLAALVIASALILFAPRVSAEIIAIPGLEQPVEILHDRFGIAHITARTEHDLFFTQGWNAASDRLFQLELWRRQATGTLAEIQGERALNHDIGARLLRFRGDMTRELKRYHPRGDSIVAAFVDGINAYIESTEREPARLPLEFRVLGIKPLRWTPEVVVSRHNGLFRNVKEEVRLARLVQLLGPEPTRELLNLHPGRPRLSLDPDLARGPMSEAVLGPYTASREPVVFSPDDVQPAYRGEARTAAGLGPDFERESLWAAATWESAPIEGSNNWVISAEHTFTRAPILANDPHRAIQLPSLRYWVHLVAPGWNVIGAGEPALPGVAIGHNERGAWGFTIFAIDQEDLYVYETDSADSARYRFLGDWESMRIVRETIRVKGRPDVMAELKFTRHGPVLYEDRTHNRAYALRAAWLDLGAAPYLASLRIDQARTWAEFREACRHFLTPSENLVWADVDGHIGWQAVGLAPVRRNWDGLLPVPGDGRYEWESPFSDPDRLPHRADPPDGRIATANQDNLPTGYPFGLGFQWTDAFRFSRIDEVLQSGRRFTLGDMMRLQHDQLALPARSLVPLLLAAGPFAGKASEAISRLKAWDFVLDQDSVAAAIYVAWERVARTLVWECSVPRGARAIFPVISLSTEKVIQWLTTPDGRFGADPVAGRDALLAKALALAIDALERRLGPDMSRWQYGQAAFKHVLLKHPLSGAVKPELRARLDLGPRPRGGYAHTVNSTSDSDNQSTGASFRIVVDLGDWDRALGTNTPGQSGDPESPHYRDLFEPWCVGKYFSVFYSAAKIESAAERKTVLTPANTR
jgi:penicillin amidase